MTLLIWRLIYKPDNSGFLNAFLALFGAHPQSWLQDPLLMREAIMR